MLPSRYVIYQDAAPAADEEQGDLPRVYLQVLHHSQEKCLASTTCGCWNAELTSSACLDMPFRHSHCLRLAKAGAEAAGDTNVICK